VAATPAYAAGGDVKVVNTETVQVYTSPTGEVKTRRVYEQLDLTGNGPVDLKNPISTDHLRNLDGFGSPDVKGGEQIVKTTVSGEKNLRSVSNYNGDLPLHVSVAYKLNGKNVTPGDVVGKDGKLQVQYTVENVTGKTQEVTFDDGNGGTVTKSVEVPIPIVGSLSTVAPSSFTNVKSAQANMGGDGKGGTSLSFTMTLFPPIGSTTAVFGYTADIKDGVIPRAEISALPVNPLESPSFKSAGTSYQGGASTGADLTAGASTIDANVLKLRDGAATLLAGLLKLRDGADQLNSGLAGDAVPGSQKLANGADDLNDGLGQINAGAKKLAAGTGDAFAGGRTLSAGSTKLHKGVATLGEKLPELKSGVGDLSAGQLGLVAGLKDLYDGVDALPASVRTTLAKDVQYQTLLGSLQAIADGVGKKTDLPTAGTLLGGINAVQYGMRWPTSILGPNDCEVALTGGDPQKCGALDGVDLTASALAAGAGQLHTQLVGPLQDLYAINNTGGTACTAGPPQTEGFVQPPAAMSVACNKISGIYFGLFGASPQSAATQIGSAVAGLGKITTKVDQQLLGKNLPAGHLGGLDQLRAGLSNGDPADCLAAKQTSTPADDCGIKEGALFLENAGIPALVDAITNNISAELKAGIGTPTAGCDPTKTLRCAAAALATGGGDLNTGVLKLVAGVQKLDAGSAQLASGAGQLSSGIGQLNTGAGTLADGITTAHDGSGQLASGADTLSSGLQDAANGSGKLADGLATAAGGAPKLKNGAQKLSDQGTKKLVAAGKDTAQNYGELYAVMKAGADRANTEDMAFGAPADAAGLTAYDYIINGDDGESGRNVARGLAGLAVLGAGGGVFALRRRFI
jgi:putative membrane protein